MAVAIRTITRLQDADDAPVLGAGQDGYALTWDNASGAFVATALLSGGLLATGATTGATSQAQAFANGIIGPTWKPASDSASAIRITNASGSLDVIKADTSNNYLYFVAKAASYTETAGVQAVTFYPNYSGDNAVYSDYLSGSSSIPIALGAWPYAKVLRITPTARVGIGGGSNGVTPDSTLHVQLDDAATNAVSQLLTLSHNTSGTAAAGFGSGVLWELESSTTADQSAARVQALWYEATHATRKADLVLTAYDTAEREGLRIRGAGSAPAIGFLGATPIVRKAHVADPSGGATVDAEARSAINSILATLEGFGFHATS